MTVVDLSIVIVSWNTQALLRACLASLPKAVAPLRYEVLVVDNGSRDATPAMLRHDFPSVTLIEAGENLGFARANNRAFRVASGRYILMLNPDTVCPPGSLAALVDHADRHPGHGGYGPLLIDAEGRPTITYGHFPSARYHWIWPLGLLTIGPRWARLTQFVYVPRRGEHDRTVPYVAGACMLIPRDMLATVGDLDEQFFLYFEETDWCRRAWERNLPIRLCMASEVVHLEGQAALQASAFSVRQFHHSLRLYARKHHGRLAVWNFRAALFWEYAGKAALRVLLPTDRVRNRARARRFWSIALLQLHTDIAPAPPLASTTSAGVAPRCCARGARTRR